jgi:uncharacterized membrane protein
MLLVIWILWVLATVFIPGIIICSVFLLRRIEGKSIEEKSIEKDYNETHNCEDPESRKFTIADGCRFQLPFTVEDFTNKGLLKTSPIKGGLFSI